MQSAKKERKAGVAWDTQENVHQEAKCDCSTALWFRGSEGRLPNLHTNNAFTESFRDERRDLERPTTANGICPCSGDETHSQLQEPCLKKTSSTLTRHNLSLNLNSNLKFTQRSLDIHLERKFTLNCRQQLLWYYLQNMTPLTCKKETVCGVDVQSTGWFDVLVEGWLTSSASSATNLCMGTRLVAAKENPRRLHCRGRYFVTGPFTTCARRQNARDTNS